MRLPWSKSEPRISPEVSSALARFLDAGEELARRDFRQYAWLRFQPMDLPHANDVIRGGDIGAEVFVELARRVKQEARKLGKKRRGGFLSEHATPEGRFYCRTCEEILRYRPTFTDDQLVALLEYTEGMSWPMSPLDDERFARIVTRKIAKDGLNPKIASVGSALVRRLARKFDASTQRARLDLERALRGEDPKAIRLDENWQIVFESNDLYPFAEAAVGAKGKCPSPAWRNKVDPLLKGGREQFLDAFEKAVDALRKQDEPVEGHRSDMLRGFCWMAGLSGGDRATRLLGEMLLVCGQKLPGVGARSQKGFTSCLTALETIGTFDALSQLALARPKVKTHVLLTALEDTLERAAASQGISIAEVEEAVVPTCGLDASSRRTFKIGDVESELSIEPTGAVSIEWRKQGKALKSKPKFSDGDKRAVSEITATKKAIEAALRSQKARLESLFLLERSWPFSVWRDRYLDHPLISSLARRLIWRFQGSGFDVLGIAPDGKPVDIEDRTIHGLDDNTAVRLWHPLDSGLSAIEAWREYLVSHEIQQPFKQAYREVYIVTDAERVTRTYSNRFAAHILKQYQCAALMRQRGWRYSLQGYFDSINTPSLSLPSAGLVARFAVDVPYFDGGQDANYVSDTGIAFYVVTDQVRFEQQDGSVPVPLEEVPPRLFSEVMRDIDLFVSVTSIGNDPTWQDHPEPDRFGEYWNSFAFGMLSESAHTREAVLRRLLPRLSISDKAHIDGRYLVVRGKLRTYKIHLGSGHVLMSPNDQYLCIVTRQSAAEISHQLVYLPFEGDTTLAIILSKAFMLANDTNIKDPTIVSQIMHL